MSLLYIVDGYNVIKRSSLFKNKRLQDAREGFFSYIELNRPHGSLKNRLMVVFDGAAEVFGFQQRNSFEVVFTSGETADDKIKAVVASSDHPKNIVVITDDKELAFSVRRYGAKIMSTSEFLSKRKDMGAIKESSKIFEDISTKSGLNIVQRESITEELKKIWLGKK